ncbi:MGH1-like glycoside hydrolase domain-containing protein [Rhodoplanes sp. SY1]|uniref:MGH1-like glycoside hydrolase domain-containing protein n=1 Tax=Rhodoplanes sp. SY1 TaxID=3166646 RepID=UPI0038B54660
MSDPLAPTAEGRRLAEANAGAAPWRRFGPYVSDRQWGTVREDYSASGDAWSYLSHDAARSRAYRWGEDAIGGWCDVGQHLCLGLALWNGADPILKERFFGLTNGEGNHGEDVKEIWHHLDATPTHSYARMLYKYPQAAFPYGWLVAENRRRGRGDREFELLDTGVFDQDRYFDVTIEYAKADPNDTLWRITVTNRGDRTTRLTVLPQIWFRNTWSWTRGTEKPVLSADGGAAIRAAHPLLGPFTLHLDVPDDLLFCENETNVHRLFGTPPVPGFFKDGIGDYVVNGFRGAVNPARTGTKAAALHVVDVPPGGSVVLRARLCPGERRADAFSDFDAVLTTRIAETEEFFAALQAPIGDPDMRAVQRQALAGLLWSKQFYALDVTEWLRGDPAQPAPPPERRRGRNSDWHHLVTASVIAMPDKWEYPWFAAWDWAFHLATMALVDTRFAKDQLLLLCQPWMMHPNGQLPAYEWNFSDVNPPVHAWAALRIYAVEKARRGIGDRVFLEAVFIKLLLNFTWWVNRKDQGGRNVFQGGFLGLDNIGVFDRSRPLPVGGTLTQSDGTSWMAMFCLNMLKIALELARDDAAYQDIASKFFEHFLLIGGAMTNLADEGIGLWDDRDGFYYDWLLLESGEKVPLRLRSMVGLIPLFAVEILDEDLLAQSPVFVRRMEWYLTHRPELAALVSRPQTPGADGRRLLAVARAFRMKAVLARMLDETEFLSDHGIRAVSRVHRDHPYVFVRDGYRAEVRYTPGESDTGLFGGNSNWRGPVWMPVNYLIVESLDKFALFYGEDFEIECPTGSGVMMSLAEVADELRRRLTRLFLRDPAGRRAVFGDHAKLQDDPHFRDHLVFHEYFDGDSGRGVGASHQTGWTALVANLIDELAREGR